MPRPNFKKVTFLCMQQLTNFPYIEEDFDALTNYELLSKVVEYLNKVIANENEQNESIIELYNSFNDLKNYVDNYFENLDVQDEINNKLDEMLEDGVLDQIIEQYLQSSAIWGFDTVADMKAATNLIDGSYARTLGYYSKNDGGGAIYKISETLPLTYYETLNNGLYAALNEEKSVVVNQLGAYGDGTHDDSVAIQRAIDNYSEIIFLQQTYLLENTITIDSINPQTIKGINNNSIIKIDSNIYAFTIENLKDKVISDLYFDITSGGILETTNNDMNIDFSIKNITGNITDSNNDIIKIVDLHHLKIENINLKNNSPESSPTAIKLDGVVNGTINKNYIGYFENGIKFSNVSTKTNEGIIISENLFYQNKNQIINDTTNTLLFIDINNNTFDYCETSGIKLQNIESSIINNNYIGINNENCNPIYIRQINNPHIDLSIIENKILNYKTSMVNPFIKINDTSDNIQNGLKIYGNHVTGYKIFAEINKVNYGTVLNNTSQTSISPNTYLSGDSINNIKYDNNHNGGAPIYMHSFQSKNRNLYEEYTDVKSDISHDTWYKPAGSNGFYLYITFANTTQTSVLVYLSLSKDGVNTLGAGNLSISKDVIYSCACIYVPAGYSFKYTTANSSDILIQNAHAMY